MPKIINRTEERVHPDNIQPHPANPNDGDVAAIAESIRQNGFYGRIVVRDSTGKILAGEHRWRAAQEVGLAEVPIERVECDDETAMRILLADNRTAEKAEREQGQLADLLEHLDTTDDRLHGTGYSGDDLDELLDDLDRLPGDDVDDPGAETSRAEELQEEWGTERGQLWQVGRHRLLCGDATEEGDVERLLGGAEPTVLWTDPPYGIDYETMRDGSQVDNDGDLETAEDVIRSAFGYVAGAEVRFACCDWRSVQMIRACFEAVGWDDKACIVWDKEHGVQNLDRFAKSHELVVYSGPYGGRETVDRDVWAFPREYEVDHATPKPVDLVAQSLFYVERGEVYDPFVGSGTIIIAAEQEGRTCYAMEIDPSYVAVCLERASEAGMECELISS